MQNGQTGPHTLDDDEVLTTILSEPLFADGVSLAETPQPHLHDHNCSGCPLCSPACAAQAQVSTHTMRMAMLAAVGRPHLRIAIDEAFSARQQLRVARAKYEPPDPWAAATKRSAK